MVENFGIFLSAVFPLLCFDLFSKFKTDGDTKTSIMKFLDILNGRRDVFLKGTMV